MTKDAWILSKVKAVDEAFAKKLEKDFGGSLDNAVKAMVNDQVEKWLEKHGVLKEVDPR